MRADAITREEAIRLKAACAAHLRVRKEPHGDRRLVPDYKYVSTHSQPHRPARTVRRVYHDDLPSEAPNRGGGSQHKPSNDPFAIALRVWAIWHHASPTTIAKRGVQAVRRRINEDGKGEIARTTFSRLWPDVVQILNGIPQVEYVDPREGDLAQVVDKIRGVGDGDIVRVGSFALTLRPIFAALLYIRRERPGVELRVLFDWKWCWSCREALEGLVELYEAHVEIRHKKWTTIHMKAVMVGGNYCFSGSANMGAIAFGGNVELCSIVTGPDCMGACQIFDAHWFGYICPKTNRLHREARVTNDEDIAKMKRKIQELRENPRKNLDNPWSSAIASMDVADDAIVCDSSDENYENTQSAYLGRPGEHQYRSPNWRRLAHGVGG